MCVYLYMIIHMFTDRKDALKCRRRYMRAPALVRSRTPRPYKHNNKINKKKKINV